MSISLEQKTILQKGKCHSYFFWKAFQTRSNYFSFHRHFKFSTTSTVMLKQWDNSLSISVYQKIEIISLLNRNMILNPPVHLFSVGYFLQDNITVISVERQYCIVSFWQLQLNSVNSKFPIISNSNYFLLDSPFSHQLSETIFFFLLSLRAQTV